jgi:hypothetical protein
LNSFKKRLNPFLASVEMFLHSMFLILLFQEFKNTVYLPQAIYPAIQALYIYNILKNCIPSVCDLVLFCLSPKTKNFVTVIDMVVDKLNWWLQYKQNVMQAIHSIQAQPSTLRCTNPPLDLHSISASI